MDEPTLSHLAGSIIAVAPPTALGQHVRYDSLRLRISDSRETTIRTVIAPAAFGRLLVPEATVGLFFLPSPAGGKFLFAIDAEGQRHDVIEAVGRDQARARRQAVKWLLIAIPLCLVVVGFLVLVMTIRGLIVLSRLPSPKDMRAFLAAHPPVPAQSG